MAKPLVAELRDKLKRVEAEREHLLALIAIYDGTGSGRSHATNGLKRVFAPKANSKSNIRFVVSAKRTPAGPTTRITAVLEKEDGLTYSEIVARALDGMVSKAGNPERSIGSTLQSLVQRGVVVRRDKKHYLANRGES